MKVTKHLLEQFISLKEISQERILVELSKIGLEVESFNEIKIPNGVVVGKVLQKSKHPDADKLSVCQIDVGNEVLQIVCGASNVDEGQWVAVALEGSRLQTPKGELVIQTTALRGLKSQGMICSSVELGLPKINEGIMVLDSSIGDLECGRALGTYEIFNNFVIELGLTPNRGDCLSILGVARDLSVVFGVPVTLKNYRDENTVLGIGRVLQVVCEGNFSSSVMYKVANLEKIDTPLEVALSLALCDIELQSPVQNFLNYGMHNVGVILRVYPFADFQDEKKLQSKGEISLRNENGLDCVCGDGVKSIVGISPNVVKKTEGMIVLEASYIHPKIVSELIYNHQEIEKDGQITYKTTRGSNPDLLLGIQFLCDTLMRFAQIEIYSSHHRIALEEQHVSIKTTFEEINAILGQRIDKEEIANLLKKIGFRIEASSDDVFFMAIPPIYRHDICGIQDISEEILRFYGIEKIQNKALKFREQSPRKNALYFRFKAKRNLMKRASAQGFYETLHYVFCQREKMQRLGLECLDEHLDILNPITNELDTLRTSLIPSMLDSIERNKNLDFKAIALCETGICYDRKRQEVEKIAFVVDALRYAQSLSYPRGEKWDFYSFASSIAQIVGEFKLEKIEDWNLGVSSVLVHPFQSAWVVKNGQRIGYLGKINPQSAYDEGFVCEMLLNPLLVDTQAKKQEISRFQANTRDLTIMINKEIPFSQIEARIQAAKIPYLQTFYPLDLYHHESFENQFALSLRFVLQSMEKTLQEEELSASMQAIVAILEEKFGASLRQ